MVFLVPEKKDFIIGYKRYHTFRNYYLVLLYSVIDIYFCPYISMKK
jgi:hypothetical protein